ncbi:MAG: integration host factor subunit beta [Alphaproteobacteria bacterium]|nr:integration host factor subunit beta [Alphaproteobacteria bacterium]
MKRSDLIRALWKRNKGLSLPETEAIVISVFDKMKESLVKGDRIELRGFGVFTPKTKIGYMARNPRTGEKVEVASSRSIRFKLGKTLFDKINK